MPPRRHEVQLFDCFIALLNDSTYINEQFSPSTESVRAGFSCVSMFFLKECINTAKRLCQEISQIKMLLKNANALKVGLTCFILVALSCLGLREQ
jgi:hypothetical protein